jgi:hypothetical protein
MCLLQIPRPFLQRKKGHKGPVAHRQFEDGLAIPGGAPSYDYQLLSNKIAHSAVLGIISLRQFIWVAATGVKELSRCSELGGPLALDALTLFTRVILTSSFTRI